MNLSWFSALIVLKIVEEKISSLRAESDSQFMKNFHLLHLNHYLLRDKIFRTQKQLPSAITSTYWNIFKELHSKYFQRREQYECKVWASCYPGQSYRLGSQHHPSPVQGYGKYFMSKQFCNHVHHTNCSPINPSPSLTVWERCLTGQEPPTKTGDTCRSISLSMELEVGYHHDLSWQY